MTVTASHELFEHTADVGLRVRAGSLDALFVEAARGLTALLVDDPGTVRPAQAVEIMLDADEPADLLVDWLAELLYAFESGKLLLSEFAATLRDGRLQAVARGEPYDPARHTLGSEVKAVTYHGLRLEREGDGWVAEVVLDI